MNKYNEIMSHVRVDDDMHRRVMAAVSKALDEPAAVSKIERNDGNEYSGPVRKKAKISVLRIFSIAACAVLVAGGAIVLARNFSGSTKSANYQALSTAAAVEEDAGHVKSDKSVEGIRSNGKERDNATVAAGETEALEEETTSAEVNAALGGDKDNKNKTFIAGTNNNYSSIKTLMPFRVKTVGSSTYGEMNISSLVFTGENGEKAVLFFAKEGTDLVKNYYPKFKGEAALLQSEGGQVFYAIDTSVGAKQQVGTTGPYDAVTWTKNGTVYMLTFNTKTDVAVFISLMEKIG